MKKLSDEENLELLREKLIGLGEKSFRKSYYPELQHRQQDLERFRALLDQSNDIIILVEIPSRLISDINESGCRQLGYYREELLNTLIEARIKSGEMIRLNRMLLTVADNGETLIFTTMLVKRNGDLLPVEANIRQVAFDDSMYAVVVARDISERQAAEKKIRRQNRELQIANQELSASYQAAEAIAKELEESQKKLIAVNAELYTSQERLELALWGARAGFWDWQINIDIVTANQRCREICGYDPEVSGHRISEWEARVHPDDWPDVNQALCSHLEGRSPFFEAEYRVKNNPEEWIWVLDSGKVVSRDENGQPERVVGIMQEITGRKQVEQSLVTSSAIYRGIFTATSNPVFLMDIEDFTILDANPAAQITFAYDQEELKQMKINMLSSTEPAKAYQRIAEQINLALRQGTSILRDVGKKKTGESVPVVVHFAVIPVEDQNIIMAVVFDLSEEVRYQQEKEKLARYQAQALKMTTLSIMSAGVVHEISQPLNAIKVLADGMLYWQEMGRETSIIKAMDTFSKISIQAERINDIIRHMRNLASAGEEHSFSRSDLNSALSGTMQVLGRQLAAHGIEVQLYLDHNLPPILGQEERVEEIIINLVVNAMNALDEHGQLGKAIICRTGTEGSRVILEISDNGPGIKSELGRQIWEPFFTTRKGGEGMGLGLVIVQSIVSRLGGHIIHYNNEWGGATFKVEFPALAEKSGGILEPSPE